MGIHNSIYSNTVLVVLSPLVKENEFRQNFNISVKNEKRSLDEIWLSSYKQMKENVIDFNVIERVDYKINSIEGKKTESTATFESINVYLITYEFIVNSKLITITFSNEANLIRLQKPIVESIIETLTFK